MDYNIVFPEREWELVHISTEVTVTPPTQKMFQNFFQKVLTPNCYLLDTEWTPYVIEIESQFDSLTLTLTDMVIIG